MKEVIKSQYRASFKMLRQAIERCPVALWENERFQNQFWHIAYHTIFYTHFYLFPSEEDFVPWGQHRDEIVSLEASEGMPSESPYTQKSLLEYLQMCQEHMEGQVDSMDFAADSGFYWLPFDKLELQFYNIRHLQQHTGELSERLGSRGEIMVEWVGMMPQPEDGIPTDEDQQT